MKKIIEQFDGIIISHPQAFFKRYDKAVYERGMQKLNTVEGKVWYRVMRNLPAREFLYIYTCYDGLIQHRTNLVELIRNKTMTFPRPEGEPRKFYDANAIVLGPPFVKAPYEIPMKGFQGFHYTHKLF